MPSLSEFVSFVSKKSGIKSLELIDKDIGLHKILKEISSSNIGQNYLFKGGSCLVKCYFGYYRFSVDLDFTWKDQEVWKGLGKKKLRKELLNKISEFGFILEKACKQVNLDFKPILEDKRFLEFGGGGRMVTFKLWKGSELVKIQVNYVEKILFEPKKMNVKTLLDKIDLSEDEKVYFGKFLDFYKPLSVIAYDEREILCEKVRAILTRKAQKLRDFYDLFILQKHGLEARDLENEILEKIKASLYYKKYRDALKKNREKFEIGQILADPFERNLFVEKPEKEFEDFLKSIVETIRKIAIKFYF
jgi:predicted nucleotidyltransferase component of viral defense system